MRSGLLKHPITFQSPTETRDAAGGVAKAWTDEYNDRARISPVRGREYFMADKVRADVTHMIVIRSRPDKPLPTYRIKWTDNGTDRYFQIDSIVDVEERDRETQIYCKETV